MTTAAPIPRALMRAVVRRAVRPQLRPSVALDRRRRNIELLSTMRRLPAGTRVDSTRLGPVPAERVDLPGLDQQRVLLVPEHGHGRAGVGHAGHVPGLDQQRVLLYLHGGGYTIGSPRSHRALVAHLAASAGRPAFTLDYRLAPEHPFPAAVDDAEAAYHALLRAGFRATDIAVAGDSAGGGLAVSLALRLRDHGVALPACLALISPWADLTLSDPSTRNDRRDVLLRTAWLERSAADYADRLAARLVHDGVSVDVRRFVDMWHVWHLHAGLVAAPTRAVRELGAFVRTAASPGDQP